MNLLGTLHFSFSVARERLGFLARRARPWD